MTQAGCVIGQPFQVVQPLVSGYIISNIVQKPPINQLTKHLTGGNSGKEIGEKKEKRNDDDVIAPKRKPTACERRSLAEMIKIKVANFKFIKSSITEKIGCQSKTSSIRANGQVQASAKRSDEKGKSQTRRSTNHQVEAVSEENNHWLNNKIFRASFHVKKNAFG